MGMLTSGDPRPVITCDPTAGAKQSFKEECDINTILRRHRDGAMVSHVNANPGVFADVTGFTDYREVLERLQAADEYFSSLSAKVRGRFENDPAFFLDFVADPENREELVELGLGPAVEEAVVEPPMARVAPVEPVAPTPEVVPPVEG